MDILITYMNNNSSKQIKHNDNNDTYKYIFKDKPITNSLALMLRLPPYEVNIDNNLLLTKLCYINTKNHKDLFNIGLINTSDRWGGTSVYLNLNNKEDKERIYDFIEQGVNTIYVLVDTYKLEYINNEPILYISPLKLNKANNQWKENFTSLYQSKDVLDVDESLIVYHRDPLRGFDTVPILTTNNMKLSDIYNTLNSILPSNINKHKDLIFHKKGNHQELAFTYYKELLLKS